MECVFSSAPSAKSCYVNVIGVTSKNKTFAKNSSSDLAVQGCIDNLPAGNYTVYVYEVENDIPLTSILPAIILRDIVITDISTTSILPTTSKLEYFITCSTVKHNRIYSTITCLAIVNYVVTMATTATPKNNVNTTLSTKSTPPICQYIV